MRTYLSDVIAGNGISYICHQNRFNMQSNTQSKQPGLVVSFVTAGMGGMMGWVCVHPFNTAAVRMNLAAQSAAPAATVNVSFIPFTYSLVQKEGFGTLYAGLSAGLLRQVSSPTFTIGKSQTSTYRAVCIV